MKEGVCDEMGTIRDVPTYKMNMFLKFNMRFS